MNRKLSTLITAICVLVPAVSRAGVSRTHTTVTMLSGFGQPLQSLQQNDLQIFATGQINFVEVEDLPNLGPIFNSRSCAACHFQPALGGGTTFASELRVRNNPSSGPVQIFAVDNMLRLGSQTQGSTPIFPEGMHSTPLGCQITSPGCEPSPCQKEELARTTFSTGLPLCDPSSSAFAQGANCSAEREAPPLFGLGLVEAVDDSTFTTLAANEPAAIRGTVKTVQELGAQRVARFGFKDDIATLRGFSGNAYLNEMGITNPDFPQELSQCAMDETYNGIALQISDDPEDTTDPDGRADIDRFTDFIRALSPPPVLAQNSSASTGKQLFSQLGCDGCHQPTLTTSNNPQLPPTTGGVQVSSSLIQILANQQFNPYSDFLLHDMGSLGDGITSGVAGPTMMRTTPLWGIRAKSVFLHDGRAADIPTAISLHDGQGKAAAQAFGALSQEQQQNVVDFLNTL